MSDILVVPPAPGGAPAHQPRTATIIEAWISGVDAVVAAGVSRATLARMCECTPRLVSIKTWQARPVKTTRRPAQTARAILRAARRLADLAEYPDCQATVGLMLDAILEYEPMETANEDNQ